MMSFEAAGFLREIGFQDVAAVEFGCVRESIGVFSDGDRAALETQCYSSVDPQFLGAVLETFEMNAGIGADVSPDTDWSRPWRC
jgi:hypothetical protein